MTTRVMIKTYETQDGEPFEFPDGYGMVAIIECDDSFGGGTKARFLLAQIDEEEDRAELDLQREEDLEDIRAFAKAGGVMTILVKDTDTLYQIAGTPGDTDVIESPTVEDVTTLLKRSGVTMELRS